MDLMPFRVRVPEPGTKVELQFEGLNGKQDGYVSVHPEKAGWRYGFVASKRREEYIW